MLAVHVYNAGSPCILIAFRFLIITEFYFEGEQRSFDNRYVVVFCMIAVYGQKPILYLGTCDNWSQNILKDFRNAPFYMHCPFQMADLRMLSISYFILLHNKQ